MTKPKKQAEEIALIYDGECPVCTAYSCSVDVDEGQASGIRRIDARSDDALVKQAKEAGLDLDEGMVVLHHGKLYHGADALNFMARLAPDRGFGNRLNRLLFSNATVSRLSYPMLRAGRNTLLWLLGRKKIRRLTGPPPGELSRRIPGDGMGSQAWRSVFWRSISWSSSARCSSGSTISR